MGANPRGAGLLPGIQRAEGLNSTTFVHIYKTIGFRYEWLAKQVS
jgi:hypothetical protein